MIIVYRNTRQQRVAAEVSMLYESKKDVIVKLNDPDFLTGDAYWKFLNVPEVVRENMFYTICDRGTGYAADLCAYSSLHFREITPKDI